MTSPAELAERLADAEHERRAIPQLVDELPDLDVGTAYDVQRLRFERRIVEGDTQSGYKLGLTSRAKQEAMGVDAPLWGRLSTAMGHPEEQPLAVGDLIHPRVEPEIAFLIGSELRGPGVSVPTVLAATDGVFPALEVLDSRYVDFKFTLPDVIADNASAARVVLGGRMLPPARLDLQREGIVLRADGEVVATAAGAAVSGHPAAAVAWLANAVERIESGSIVLSGGLTPPVPLAGVGSVTAEYTSLGSVTVRTA